MASSRKRSRPSLEESQAECPFYVTHPDPKDRTNKPKRSRQLSEDSHSSQSHSPKIPLQPSPFAPMGKFRDPANTMDRHYQIQPYQKWNDMTRYNSFVLNGVKYWSEGFIFVANGSTIERQKNPSETLHPKKKSDDDWVARILEIRASDEHHVYARVYWMYWPDELPAGTKDGKKMVQGRQPYHGLNELVASNHMDVINVVSVTAPATVNQWDENNEEEVQKALYWRQAIDVRCMELSSAEPRCQCLQPENPDKTLIGCTNEKCKAWLHEDCLIHEVLMKTYKRLGTDKAHQPAPAKGKIEREDAKRPLSPSESGAAQAAKPSIDVKSDEPETLKLADVEAAPSPIKAEDTSNGSIGAVSEAPKRRGRPRKSDAHSASATKPYRGLFEAVVHNEGSSPVFELRDLRENMLGGEKSWTEPVICLLCEHAIH
ncbi:hypothetical protein F4780DRAFT_309423 [Xylariomycetidae sp. FL0641]|nr:hypothetical protein F4780DRAFT_309423 [Xylariomycetidae sp. FL0641]